MFFFPGSKMPALNFIDLILGKAANGSPGGLGLTSMEIIEAACESAQTGRNEIIRDVRSRLENIGVTSPDRETRVSPPRT